MFLENSTTFICLIKIILICPVSPKTTLWKYLWTYLWPKYFRNYIMHSTSFISLWFLLVNIQRKMLWTGFKTNKYGTHSSKVIIIGIPIPVPIKLLICFSSRIRMKHSMFNHLVFHFSHWSCFCIWQVWTKFPIGHFIE